MQVTSEMCCFVMHKQSCSSLAGWRVISEGAPGEEDLTTLQTWDCSTDAPVTWRDCPLRENWDVWKVNSCVHTLKSTTFNNSCQQALLCLLPSLSRQFQTPKKTLPALRRELKRSKVSGYLKKNEDLHRRENTSPVWIPPEHQCNTTHHLLCLLLRRFIFILTSKTAELSLCQQEVLC